MGRGVVGKGRMLVPVVIEAIRPSTPSGYPAKAVVGERVTVGGDIFRDGHDLLVARVRWRRCASSTWQVAPMRPLVNDRWEATIEPADVGLHEFVIDAWSDRYGTWAHDVEIKAGAGQDIALELEEGARIVEFLTGQLPSGDGAERVLASAVAGLRDTDKSRDARLNAGLDDYIHGRLSAIPDPVTLTSSAPMPLRVDRPLARFGAWYELFPRSEGGLVGAVNRLPAIADMGFDI